MTTQTEALKLAREALVRADRISGYPNNKQTITAIDKALAQPEQEPVAKVSKRYVNNIHWLNQIPEFDTLLYTTPPQSKPLTDEQIIGIARVTCIGISPHEDTVNLVRAIEAAHGIKE